MLATTAARPERGPESTAGRSPVVVVPGDIAPPKLPPLHRDPFDRMLVCQVVVEGVPILTPDAAITQYPIRAAWD